MTAVCFWQSISAGTQVRTRIMRIRRISAGSPKESASIRSIRANPRSFFIVDVHT